MRNQTRIGISSLIFNLNEALKICEENNEINHIEIGIDNISDCEELKKYKEQIKRLNLSVGIHLPMELNPCEDIEFIKQKWIEYIVIISENLNFLDISYYNMHLGYAITNRLKKNKEKYLNNIVDFFEKLSMKEKRLSITIENTYTKGGDVCNVGSDVEDFIYILDHNKNISFCYDSGHDLISSSNYLSLKNKTKVVHLSDNNGIEDEHLGIFNGKLKENNLQNILLLNPQFIVLEVKFDYIEDSLHSLKKNYHE
ncbi:sugar phosphate isomerase/epimerase family protein [Terrisporobacter sp.]